MKTNTKPILHILLICVFLVGMSFAGTAAPNEDKEEKNLPEFGCNIHEKLEKNSKVIKVNGTIPEIKDEKEKRKWLDKLDKNGKKVNKEMLQYMQPNGPLVSCGYNYQGYLVVDILEGSEIDESMIDDIYEIYNKQAKKDGIKEVPVVFQYSPQIEVTSRSSTWNPLIGGIKVDRNGGLSTLGFAVRDKTTHEEGFLVAGHSALAAGGIGSMFYQPYVDASKEIGAVDRLIFKYADAAFIEDDERNVDNKIYYKDTDQLMDVTSSEEPEVGDYVKISGLSSGLSGSGRVTDLNHITAYLGYPKLYDQCKALYSSQGGDSGSPVLDETSTSTVSIYGIHSGHATDGSYSLFSPISGISDDLNVEPLTN
jgi:streptogrisin B